VFKLSPSGELTVLHSFLGGSSDGQGPSGPLLLDDDGNLYGITEGGGDIYVLPSGCGTVFKLDRTGHETILHIFDGFDGDHPIGRLVRD